MSVSSWWLVRPERLFEGFHQALGPLRRDVASPGNVQGADEPVAPPERAVESEGSSDPALAAERDVIGVHDRLPASPLTLGAQLDARASGWRLALLADERTDECAALGHDPGPHALSWRSASPCSRSVFSDRR